MFASAFALVFTAAASARADKADDVATQLVEAFNQPKCPKLLALYAPNMVKAFGSESARSSFCGGLIATGGRMMRAQRVDAGTFHLVTERGSWRLTFALDESGLITGLNVNNFSPPLAFVKKTLRWPLGDTAAPAKETFVVHGGATSDVNHHVDNLR